MKKTSFAIVSLMLGLTVSMSAQSNKPDKPTWWEKYQYLARFGSDPATGRTTSLAAGPNVDVSNECGPQSETFITINPSNTNVLAAGSNEIFRIRCAATSPPMEETRGAAWTCRCRRRSRGRTITGSAPTPASPSTPRATSSTATSSSTSATATG